MTATRRVLRHPAMLAAMVVALCAGSFFLLPDRVNVPQAIAVAKRLMLSKDYEKALLECRRILSDRPDQTEAMIIEGECLQRLGRLDEAMRVYAAIGNDGSEQSLAARLTEASVYLQRGELTPCLAQLDIAEAIAPDSATLIALKANALTACGRRWESMPYLRKALDAGVGDPLANLIYLAVPDQMPQPNEKYLELVVQKKDPMGAIGAARIAMALGFTDRANELLSLAEQTNPQLPELHIQQSALYLNSNQTEKFLSKILKDSVNLKDHPEYWLLLGRFTQEAGQSDTAMRCYGEVVKRHPDQDRACYQLGQMLAANGQLTESRVFIERAGRLAKLVEKASLLYDQPEDYSAMAECAELTRRLGRSRESRYWCAFLLSRNPPETIIPRVKLILEQLQQQSDAWQDQTLNVASHVSLEQYPLPDMDSLQNMLTRFKSSTEDKPTPGESQAGQPSPKFTETSGSVGLQFTYRNGSDTSTQGRRMFEYTGGGVAIIDFDLDTFDDVHMTQGSDWPPQRDQREFLDQTFRNKRGLQFQNISADIGLDESGFSQGATSGDFNCDGFPDLYVANVSDNSLFQNNGDGTFSNVTEAAGVGHKFWTTSCAIADLNGDSLPDLYDVTFLQGDDVFSKICEGEEGIPRSCAPAGFEAAPDFVWENLGDGTFRSFGNEIGLEATDGDGLGILISDFDLSGRLSIFIANDGRANFFFVPNTARPPYSSWNEIGVINGTAYDATGQAQACMGVASADFDKNGLLDFFVTNFYQEANTLYVNMGESNFLDQSRRFALHDPSYGFLGFGTQFLDADLDSWQDIVVANGHVDDFRHKNIPYRMRPQLFVNDRGGRFVESDKDAAGPFFSAEHMGRGMARLDWNQDFLADIVISQLDEPSALLTNGSSTKGQGTSLRLIDPTADRDAIGTRVILEQPEGTPSATYFVTAGDGYQASNSRELILASPTEAHEFSLRIVWKSGQNQIFRNVKPGGRYIALAGRDSLWECP
ncbi:MAG: FG-GAP-like repeat-containing protein [Planctomycetaceae bacterium]